MVAACAYITAKRALPDYTSKFSRKTYTQPQLLALLVLQTFWGSSYRGTAAAIHDWSDLRQDLELKTVPSPSTLCRAFKRLMRFDLARSLLGQTTRLILGDRWICKQAAIDSTGFTLGHVSPYFVRRRARGKKEYENTTYRRWGKLTLIVDTQRHIILSMLAERGPKPDANRLVPAIDQRVQGIRIDQLVADAGYDSAGNHSYLRDEHGINSIIPATAGRRTTKPASHPYRRLMQRLFKSKPPKNYGQRWQVETVNSMIKRNFTSYLSGQTYWSQCRQMLLLAITHNLAIAMSN